MASIRRTLSPIPRSGTALNGEPCLVNSPLSRSSTTQNHSTSSGGLLSSLSSSLDAQTFVLSVFSPRISRHVDKPRQKGQLWRRALCQFLMCFMVGVFVGVTPFSSINLSVNLIAKHQAFSFEMVSTVGNLQPLDRSVSKTDDLPLDNVSAKENVTVEKSLVKDWEPMFEVNLSSISASDLESRKLLIVVTPTYARPFQAYFLKRLGHTLKLVPPPLLWIVVETNSQSSETADVLRKTGVMYRHLVCNTNLTEPRDRSVHQRNVALTHIETHQLDGILYFADDHNFYSTEIFDQMRQIRRFGVWTVAKVAENKRDAALEGPVCNGTNVIGWHISEPKRRYQRFHVDLSGFAFNSTILWDPKRWHKPMMEPIRQSDKIQHSLRVSTFIHQIVEDESQMEGLECSRIMVWHFHLESQNSVYPHEWFMKDNLDVIASLAS